MTASATVDLSVVVTAHREGLLLRPTLRSVGAAIAAFESTGGRAELLIVCDMPDDVTLTEARRWAARSHGTQVRVIEVSLGESGASRNAGVEASVGEYVTIIDGDDLVSSDYLTAGVDLLQGLPDPVIAHPQHVVSFGARSSLWTTESTVDGDLDHRDLIRHNLWPSSSIARRTVFLDHPYRALDPSAGFGPEDWIWNIDTVAAGVRHEPIPGTYFFWRTRASGGVTERHRASILPHFDLAGLRRALPTRKGPASDMTVADAASPVGGAHRAYGRLLPLVRRSTWWLSWEAKHQLYRVARRSYRIVSRRGADEPAGLVVDALPETPPGALAAMLHAAELEPALSWTATNYSTLPVWRARDDGYADVLVRILEDVSHKGRAIVLAPWIGIGGADSVALNYAKGLAASERFREATTIIGTYLPGRTVHDLIPGTIRYVQVWDRWLEFTTDDRRRLLAQALILLRPEVVVSVNCFHFTESMQNYGTQVASATRLFATLFAWDRIGPGYPTNPITDDSQRRYLGVMDGLITDNSHTAGLIDEILALPEEQVLIHPQPVSEQELELPRATRAYNNVYFSAKNPFRVLWPHRLDDEKRPDVLIPLAHELRRQGLPATIDVWGQFVLHSDEDSLLSRLQEAGVNYRGPYSGGLPALPTYDYHALLLTSQSEGMPLVLVQSLLRGLPVIASDVGGVSDLIVHGRTGMLADGPDDIDGFVSAIEQLITSRDLRQHIIEQGYEHVSGRHSWRAFRTSLDAMIG